MSLQEKTQKTIAQLQAAKAANNNIGWASRTGSATITSLVKPSIHTHTISTGRSDNRAGDIIAARLASQKPAA